MDGQRDQRGRRMHGAGYGPALLALLLATAVTGCGDAGVQPGYALAEGEGVVFLQVDMAETGGVIGPGELRLAFRRSTDPWVGAATFAVDPARDLYAVRLPAGSYRLGQVWADGLTNLLLSDGVYPQFTVTARQLNYAGRIHLRRTEPADHVYRRPYVLAFEPSLASQEAAHDQFRAWYPGLAARYSFGTAFPIEQWQPTPAGPLALRGVQG